MDCLVKVMRMPLSPLTLVYSSPALSVTTTVAMSPSVTGSMPSMPRSSSTISSSSWREDTFSPTDTMYFTPLSSSMYPAGMAKFCAVSSWLTAEMDSIPPTSVWSAMDLYASLIWSMPASIWVMASSSCICASVSWVIPSIRESVRS